MHFPTEFFSRYQIFNRVLNFVYISSDDVKKGKSLPYKTTVARNITKHSNFMQISYCCFSKICRYTGKSDASVSDSRGIQMSTYFRIPTA